MLTLVSGFSTEVGWNGFARRIGDGSEFLVEDILVYPQVVSAADSDTDPEAYRDWLHGFEPDKLRLIRFHGHSHVNMSPTPSGQDFKWQSELTSGLRKDMFYIFLIMNKGLSFTVRVYDMKCNTVFDTDEVEVQVEDMDLDGFLQEAKSVSLHHSQVSKPAKSSGVAQVAQIPQIGRNSTKAKTKKKYGSALDQDEDLAGYGYDPYGGYGYYDDESDYLSRFGL